MAYFDCIVGGSGKGNTLVVTCADELAGATITCTNGTKTYTKTCPSTAPYEVTFYGLAAGTWTVSATVSGNTYTTTVVITDYEAELGGFSWRAWVDLSKNYTSSDFTDLDELLDTELAVRELMSIHACVDYLAGITTTNADVETIIGNDLCAKWINNRDYALDTLYANIIIKGYMDTADKYFYGEWVITDDTTTPPTWGPKGNVPVMTSNTAPYGAVTATGAHSSYPAYLAFDGDASTLWYYGGSTTNVYIQYQFVNPTCVKRVFFRDGGGRSRTKNYKILASNDGFVSDSHELYVGLKQDGVGEETVTFDNDNYYLYYRLLIVDTYNHSGQESTALDNLQFYGRELKVSVPAMTSNTAPYGEASASSTYDATTTYAAFRAFDAESENKKWNSLPNGSSQYVIYKFPHKIFAKFFRVYALSDGGSGQNNISFDIEASNDGTNFTPLTEILGGAKSNTLVTNPTINEGEYQYYKLQQKSGSYGMACNTFAIYGFDYTEREFEEGTTKKWLYDHGLELETLSDVAGSTATYNHGPSSILEKQTNSSQGASVYAELDLTPYDLMRIKISQRFVGSGNKIRVLNTAQTSVIANATISDLPYNTGLDISTCDATYAIDVLALGVSEIEFNEWWLE